MTRPLLLDAFCKAGGASMGYHMAGFDVVGVDIEPQPRYPFKFIQADAVQYAFENVNKYQVIAGSPPCQAHTTLSALSNIEHVSLIADFRNAVIDHPLYVIENVPGAPLFDAVTYCGSSFGLRVRRHRLFEAALPDMLTAPPCNHEWQDLHKIYPVRVSPEKRLDRTLMSGVVPVFGGLQTHLAPARERYCAAVAMGIDWMTKPELNQAIPPAYTLHIGQQLMRILNDR